MSDVNTLRTKIQNGQNTDVINTLNGVTNIYSIVGPAFETLLHIAVKANNVTIADYLINTKGMLVDVEDWDLATPLYYAARDGLLSMVQFLVTNKAHPTLRNGALGYTPSEITTSQPIKDALTATTFFDNYSSMYKKYKLKAYMVYLTNFSRVFHGNSYRGLGMPIMTDVDSVFSSQGLMAVSALVKAKKDDYLTYTGPLHEQRCLVDNIIGDPPLLCGFCRRVRFHSVQHYLDSWNLHSMDCLKNYGDQGY